MQVVNAAKIVGYFSALLGAWLFLQWVWFEQCLKSPPALPPGSVDLICTDFRDEGWLIAMASAIFVGLGGFLIWRNSRQRV